MLHKEIKKYLENFTHEQLTPNTVLVEYHIANEIERILKNDKEYEPTEEDIAECMAFLFFADCPNTDMGWGEYYGPIIVFKNDQGQMVENPSIRKVSQETLEYWTKRAKESKHPILKQRYADLVIDFSPKILGKKSTDNDLFKIVIDSIITICEEVLTTPLECKTKVMRAFNLAVYKQDPARIVKAKNVIINLINQKKVLGFGLELLVLNSKNIFGREEKIDLIKQLEKELEEIKQDPWLTEHVVSLLAEYYAKEKDRENLMRVLNILENSFKADKRLNSEALLKVNVYDRMHKIYRKYANMGFDDATEASERILQERNQLDLDLEKSFKTISTEIKISREDIDKYINFIFGKDNDSKLETVIGKIALCYLPNKDVIEKQLDDISSKHPLQFLINTQIFDDKDILIGTLSPLDENSKNSHLIYHSQLYIQSSWPFLLLSDIFYELKKRFSAQAIITFFEESILFKKDEKKYIERAISSYWENDFLVSSHLFIPLIEGGIRELIEICKGQVLTTNYANGYDYFPLNYLLKKNEKIFESVFSNHGSNISLYFRTVLTEKFGMNLRNSFAHGIEKEKFFRRDVSDRLFHILILLSVVRKKHNDA